MTPDRLRECLGALNWSTAALAVMAQVSPVTARDTDHGGDPASFGRHSLRSSFVTSCVEANAPLIKVAEVTRHLS